MWIPVFFLIISKCSHFYRKSLGFSVLLFTVWWNIFDQPFRRLLPLSSFYDPSQQLFKVKANCKSKFRFGYKISDNLWLIFSPLVNVQLKRLNLLCWACLRLIIFRVNCQQNTYEKRWQLANCKLNNVNLHPQSLFYAHIVLRARTCVQNHFM